MRATLVLALGHLCSVPAECKQPQVGGLPFNQFRAGQGYGFMSAKAQDLITKARSAVKLGNFQAAETAYMDAIYSYLWEPLIPDDKQIVAAKEYANILDKLGKHADARAVRNRLRDLQSDPRPVFGHSEMIIRHSAPGPSKMLHH